jgi:RNA polymerase sigma-70 factor (ECF subfamily)
MFVHDSTISDKQECSGDTLSLDEITAAIEMFTDADWLRLKIAAQYFSYEGRCGRDWSDLQNEALVRALDGRRKCPRNVSVLTFLGNVIRSIASDSDDLDKTLRSHELDAAQETVTGAITLKAPPDPLASTFDAKRLFKEAVDLFEGDTVAQTLFEGDVDGMEGQELRELVGLTQTEFDSKRRYVRRRLNAHFAGRQS